MANARDPKWTFDEVVLATRLVLQNAWRGHDDRDEPVKRLSALLQRGSTIPLEARTSKFRNPNGVARKTWDLATVHPAYTGKATKGSKLDKDVVAMFLQDEPGMLAYAAEIEAAMSQLTPAMLPTSWNDDPLLGETLFDEGAAILVAHRRRERNPKLRKLRIQMAVDQGSGVCCEACGIDFHTVFKFLPDPTSVIDVHHVVPLHVSGKTKTSVNDLAILCPTCHRAIHRTKPFLAPAALAQLLP